MDMVVWQLKRIVFLSKSKMIIFNKLEDKKTQISLIFQNLNFSIHDYVRIYVKKIF